MKENDGKAVEKTLINRRRIFAVGLSSIVVVLLIVWLAVSPKDYSEDLSTKVLKSNSGSMSLKAEGKSVETTNEPAAASGTVSNSTESEGGNPPAPSELAESKISESPDNSTSEIQESSSKDAANVETAPLNSTVTGAGSANATLSVNGTSSGSKKSETGSEIDPEDSGEHLNIIGSGGKEATVEGVLKTLDEGTNDKKPAKVLDAEEEESEEEKKEPTQSGKEGDKKADSSPESKKESEGPKETKSDSEAEAQSAKSAETSKSDDATAEKVEDKPTVVASSEQTKESQTEEKKDDKSEKESVVTEGSKSEKAAKGAEDSGTEGEKEPEKVAEEPGKSAEEVKSKDDGLAGKEGNKTSSTVEVVSQKEKVEEKTEKSEVKEGEKQVKDKAEKKEESPVKEETKPEKQDKPEKSNEKDLGKPAKKPEIESKLDDKPAKLNLDLNWKVCPNKMADYVPCIDNKKPRNRIRSEGSTFRQNYERICPLPEEELRCLVPLPTGYKPHIKWPQSVDQIWYDNVPYPRLITSKKTQNWVRKEGDKLVFPGGGTQFVDGADKYVERLQKLIPDLEWGIHVKVALDIGCGVASFGAAMDKVGVRVQSVAPKDSHEAQVQMALERGLPAVLGYLGAFRLPYPANVYDVVHCARCRIKWGGNAGKPLIEANRVLRPGGFFIWSATPIYRKGIEDRDDWLAFKHVATSLCWKLVGMKQENKSHWGVAIWQKPVDNFCLGKKKKLKNADEKPRQKFDHDWQAHIQLCPFDDADSGWNYFLTRCTYTNPESETVGGLKWPPPARSLKETGPPTESERAFHVPYWMKGGDPSWKNETLYRDGNLWWIERVKSLIPDLEKAGLKLDTVRNVLDSNAELGGFGAALEAMPSLKLWVMNIVPITGADTLPVVFERGMIGQYQDWCEAFYTYPRTYDLIHSDFLIGAVTKRCDSLGIFVEYDRILRPNGWIIIRDNKPFESLINSVAASLHWVEKWSSSSGDQVMFAFEKPFWRPSETLKLPGKN